MPPESVDDLERMLGQMVMDRLRSGEWRPVSIGKGPSVDTILAERPKDAIVIVVEAALSTPPAPLCAPACADDVCLASRQDGILCAEDECDYHSGVRKPATSPAPPEPREAVRSVPNPCSICGVPIFGSFIGTGDGTMRAGGSFAHLECYWRRRAEVAEAKDHEAVRVVERCIAGTLDEQ